MNNKFTEIEKKIENGQRLNFDEGLSLFEQGDLLELGLLANFVRRQKHPDRIVTYIIDRNINYTNVCVAQCAFCAFYEKINSERAYLLSKDEIAAKIQETVDLGGTQILMQGGLHPKLDVSWFEDLFRFISKKFPAIRIHSLSPAEITYMAKISKLSLRETLERLRAAGLASIPGGGAEILVDEVRARLKANKTNTADWLKVMETAQKMGMKTTATMMFGHVENYKQRLEHLMHIRSLQDKNRYGLRTIFVSNSCAAYRKSVLEEVGYFGEKHLFAEDACAVGRMLLKGYSIAYVAEAQVYHSHNYTITEEFRRYFDVGAFHRQQQWLIKEFGTAGGAGRSYVRSEAAYLVRQGKIYLLPSFMLRTAMKLAGYKLGYYYTVLPGWLRCRLSMNPGWWRK